MLASRTAITTQRRPLGHPLRTLRGLLLIVLIAGSAPAAHADEPAVRPKRGRHLDLSIDRYEHDFGAAAQNQRLETTFQVTNTSAARVEGLRARGECGCNTVTLADDALEPGASTTLTVIFDTSMLSGRLRKIVRVASAEGRRGQARIQQSIAIIKDLVISPNSLTFRDVRVGDTPTATFRVRWYDGQGQPFTLTDVRVPGHTFAIDVQPYSDPEDAGWRGFEVSLTFATPPPEGMFSAEVVVETSNPERPRLTLPMFANVTGAVWLQARTLTFGAVPSGESRTVSMRFRPNDASVPFGEVTATPTLGLVTTEVGLDPIHGAKGYWFLRATLPAGVAPGALAKETIVLDVGIEGTAAIVLPVKAFVRRPKQAESETVTDGN